MCAVQIDRFFLKPKKEGSGVDIPEIMCRNHLKSTVADAMRPELANIDTIDDVNFRLMKARLQAIPRCEEDAVVPYVPVIARITEEVEAAELFDDL